MKKLSVILALAGLFAVSCEKPEPEVNAVSPKKADFMAVFSFNRAQHTQDVHPSIAVQYNINGTYSVDYDIKHHTPMIAGQGYQDTVILKDVRLAFVDYVAIECQQGYTCSNPNVNPFKVAVYKNGVFIFEDWHDTPGCYGNVHVY